MPPPPPPPIPPKSVPPLPLIQLPQASEQALLDPGMRSEPEFVTQGLFIGKCLCVHQRRVGEHTELNKPWMWQWELFTVFFVSYVTT